MVIIVLENYLSAIQKHVNFREINNTWTEAETVRLFYITSFAYIPRAKSKMSNLFRVFVNIKQISIIQYKKNDT